MSFPKWVQRSQDIGPVLCASQQEEDDLMAAWAESRKNQSAAEAQAAAAAQAEADAATLAAAEEILARASAADAKAKK